MYILKSTWMMYIFLAVIILGSGILIATVDDSTKSYSQGTWREELHEENENLTKQMEEGEVFQEINTNLIAQNNYYLEHDIQPISRSKILLSKYAAVLLFALYTLLFLVAFSWIIGALFFGVEGLNPYIVVVQGSSLEYVSVIGEIITGYGYKMVNLVMMATFAFMISSIFRNSALAIGTAVFLMMAGMTLPFSIAVLLVYFVVFLTASWGAFTKRDIAGQ